jgi:hypothetical protein
LAWWLVDMDPAATLTINPREVESIHWYTPTELWQCQDLLESNRQFFQAWRRGAFQLPHCDCPDL